MRVKHESLIANPKVLETNIEDWRVDKVDYFLKSTLVNVDYYLDFYDTGVILIVNDREKPEQYIRIVIDYVYAETETFIKLKTGMSLLDYINYYT